MKLNRTTFFILLKNNIIFSNDKEEKELIEHYNEIIDDLIEKGNSEEDAVNSFNVDSIINEFNINRSLNENKVDYKTKMYHSNVKRDFKIFSIAIISGLLVPMIISTVFLFYRFIHNRNIELADHSIRLLVIVFTMLSYVVFFGILETYIIYRFFKNKKLLGERVKAKNILLFVLLHTVFTSYQLILLIYSISENWITLFLLTLVLLLPYLFVVIKRIKITKEGF